MIGAGAMDLIGVQRVRSRDLATGVVLGVATGLSALFLYLDTTQHATTGATQQILFGSIFTVDPSTVPVVVALGVLTLAAIAVISRPLLLSTVEPRDRRRGGHPSSSHRPAVHAGARRGRWALVDRHRVHPLDGTADRTAGDRAAPDREAFMRR